MNNNEKEFYKKEYFKIFEKTKNFNQAHSKNPLYFNFLKMMLTDNIIDDNIREIFFQSKQISEINMKQSLSEIKNPKNMVGSLGCHEREETMIGLMRLENLQFCVEDVLRNNVEGDFIETGIWKGGACIFMRSFLKEYGNTEKIVYGADSFEGLPKPDVKNYPEDAEDSHYKMNELKVSLEQVKYNFEKYGLLDNQVKFLKGWFKDTLKEPPFEKLSILRMDGDMYESTIEALENLYDKLSPGGYLIVDDYNYALGCKKAVDDFRNIKNIKEDIITIDWASVYWKKNTI